MRFQIDPAFQNNELNIINSIESQLVNDSRVSSNSYLSTLVVSVEPYEDDKVSKGRTHPNPAKGKDGIVSINTASNFFNMAINDQIGIFIHEIGHIYYATLSRTDKLITSYGIPLNADMNIDCIACDWGFLKELYNTRVNSHNVIYADTLKRYSTGEQVVDELDRIHNLMLI